MRSFDHDPVKAFFDAERGQIVSQQGNDIHWQSLVRRARSRAQRRSRFLGYAAGMTAAALVIGGVTYGSFLHNGSAVDHNGAAVVPAATSSSKSASVATDNLPTAAGTGPSAQQFTASGFLAGKTVPGNKAPWEQSPVWGAVRLVTTSPDGNKTVMFTTKNAMLCIGEINPGETLVRPTVCQPLTGLPDEGFWGGGAYAPTPPEKSADQPIIVTGLIRGQVSRIVIHTPRGDVNASLAPAANPALGSLYWAVTQVPALASSEVAQIERIAYRKEDAVFSCTGSECLSQL